MPYNTFIRKTPMTTTFADYAAAQEARENIALAVLGHTLALCEALRQDYVAFCLRQHTHLIQKHGPDEHHQREIDKLKDGICPVEFVIETGRKYHKIKMIDNRTGSGSAHAFVDKQTGEIYKPANWKGPAKNVRYDLRLIEQREWLLENADWAGNYLYQR
jgi:hypothetical protein